MKKLCILLLSLGIVLSLSACRKDGIIYSDVKIHEVSSKIYKQDDIDDAMQKVKEAFVNNFDNCELEMMAYGTDDRVLHWKEYYHKDEKDLDYMLIDITFKTGSMGLPDTMNKNSIYEWTCSLTRQNNGEWQVESFGFL